jgi:intein-encoded DNA endonuclease-like protein
LGVKKGELAYSSVVSIRPRGLKRIPPFEERARLYEEVRDIMKQTMNAIEIRAHIESKFGKRLELATIKSWVAGTQSPYGRVYQLPREPVPELAYLIGVNFGDTSRCKNRRHNCT